MIGAIYMLVFMIKTWIDKKLDLSFKRLDSISDDIKEALEIAREKDSDRYISIRLLLERADEQIDILRSNNDYSNF